MGVLVPSGIMYIGLLNILFKALKLRSKNHTIGIKYVVELGTSPAKILDDLVVDFYLDPKKYEVDKTELPLCLDYTEKRMSMTVEGSYTPSIQFRQPHREIHFPNVDPIENHPEMPQESEDYLLVMATPEDTPMSFAAECIGDGLEEQSQFQTPPAVEKESAPMHNPISNGARCFVQGCSPSRTEAAIVNVPSTDGKIDSTSKSLSSENTTNHRRSSNCSRTSTEEIPTKEYDVLTQFSPTMVRLHRMYVKNMF